MDRAYKKIMKVTMTRICKIVFYVLLYGFSTHAFASMPYPKIFVHGTIGSCSNWETMINNIRGTRPYEGCITVNDTLSAAPADSFWTVEYYYGPSGSFEYTNIAAYAERLNTVVNKIMDATGSDKVILIAHSMGGLVVRSYMIKSDAPERWEAVHRFVTVGTPNLGVYGTAGLATLAPDGSEWGDLADDSDFIHDLYDAWEEKKAIYDGTDQASHRIWGIVAGTGGRDGNDPLDTDSIVEVWSSMPGEWKIAKEQYQNVPQIMTPNYGYRVALQSSHGDLLTASATAAAINWADSENGNMTPNTPGYTVYNEGNYATGTSSHFREHYPLTFTGNVANFDGLLHETDGDFMVENVFFQDAIDSLSVDALGQSITVYKDANYSNTSATITDSVSSFDPYGMHDMISSIAATTIDDNANGLADYWEDFYNSTVANFGDATDDYDSDGLTNLEEFQNQTSPVDSDTDADGLDDYFELFYHLNPIDSGDGDDDTDLDEISNADEYAAGTDPALLKNILLRGLTHDDGTDLVSAFSGKQDVIGMGATLDDHWNQNYRTLYTGDFNGDGFSDILLQGNTPDHSTYILFSNGEDSFEDVQNITDLYDIGSPAWSAGYRTIFIGDFDGNGADDILLQGKTVTQDTFLLLADGAGGFYNKEKLTTAHAMSLDTWSGDYREVHVGDFNGDGADDILLRSLTRDGNTYLLLTDGHGGFNDVQGITNSYGMGIDAWDPNYRTVHIGDFDGNGGADILLQANTVDHDTFLLSSNGTTGFNTVQGITTSYGMSRDGWSATYRHLHVGDFNGDHADDILLQGTFPASDTFIILSDGSGGIQNVQGITNTYSMSNASWDATYHNIHVGDLSDDGYDDLILQGHEYDDDTYILIADVTGGFHDAVTVNNLFGMTREEWTADTKNIFIANFYPNPSLSHDGTSDSCVAPSSGDWTITNSCQISGSVNFSQNVFVRNSSTVTLNSGAHWDLDLHSHKLVVENGSGILIKQGARIQ